MTRVAVALAVAALLLGGCGDDGGGADPGTTTIDEPGGSAFDRVIDLDVVDEELVGGSRQEDVSIGDSVQIRLTGDTADQIHVHGYDLYIDPVDGVGELTFDALIPGTFEVELEGSGRLLIRMTVS